MLNRAAKRPLVPLALIFSFGICCARFITVNFTTAFIFAAISALLSFLLLKRKTGFDISLFFLILFFAAAFFSNARILPGRHISKIAAYKYNGSYTVRGNIQTRPFFKNNTASFILKAKEVCSDKKVYNTCGNILVYIRLRKDLPRASFGVKNLDYADEVILSGNIRGRSWIKGSLRRDHREYLRDRGIYCVMRIENPALIIKTKSNKGLSLKLLASGLKGKFEGIIFKRLPYIPAVILDAMILGEKRNIPLPVRNSMSRTGSVHILVVSGFHVALAVFAVTLFLKLFRIPRALRLFICAPAIIIYCLMTGASTPAVRATVMAIALIYAPLLKREADIYNSLALAAIAILLARPSQLFDPGFQLSFASVISIAYLYPRMRRIFPERALRIKYASFLFNGFLVSFSAWLGTAGLIAYYFKLVSPVAVLTNIFVVPLASLAVLCGFSMILMEFICPRFVPLFASSSEFMVSILLNTNAFMARLPGACFYLP
ncbi:MAG: ComEC/Rec2 family competence protein [Candidatus Omnitrophota bacterium]|jgi:competence protein ComEC